MWCFACSGVTPSGNGTQVGSSWGRHQEGGCGQPGLHGSGQANTHPVCKPSGLLMRGEFGPRNCILTPLCPGFCHALGTSLADRCLPKPATVACSQTGQVLQSLFLLLAFSMRCLEIRLLQDGPGGCLSLFFALLSGEASREGSLPAELVSLPQGGAWSLPASTCTCFPLWWLPATPLPTGP